MSEYEEDRTTARGLYNYGISYWQSAKYLSLSRTSSTHPEAPKLHLYCIAIELLLKSYLRSKNTKLSELISFGHNLKKLHKESKSLGLNLSEKSVFVLELLQNENIFKESRYIVTGTASRPNFEDLEQTINNIIAAHPQI